MAVVADTDDLSLDELLALAQANVRPQPEAPVTPPRASGVLRREHILQLAADIEELEGEALRHFVPLAHVEAFHRSTKPVSILMGSNQAAKSIHMLVEIARTVLGRDPYNKYPSRDGRAVIVGRDGDHLADPLYKKLFTEGEFKLVPDEDTGKLRAVRPDPNDPSHLDPYDLAYREKWQDAPPLIPDRYVVEHAWDHANKEIPRITRFTTGWRLLWRSSNGPPPRGRQIHLAAFDEDLKRAGAWVNEMIPRLLKHNGKLIWAATGQEGGPELHELVRKAEEGSKYIDVFLLLIENNAFITDEQRAFFLDTLTNEEEVNVRYYGQLATFGRFIYADYDPQGIHGYEPFPIPPTWARYFLVDPGIQHCGTLFLAVDEEERHRWVYDGFDLRQGEPLQWAQMIKARQGDMKFEAAVMDMHHGRKRHLGGWEDKTVASRMWEALQEVGVQIRRAGPMGGFFPGSDDVDARTLALKSWLTPRGFGHFSGTPVLKVARGQIPLLDKQIKAAQTDPDGLVKRGNRNRLDLLEGLEYGAAFNPGYYPPEPLPSSQQELPQPISPAEAFREKHRRRRLKAAASGDGGRTYASAMQIG